MLAQALCEFENSADGEGEDTGVHSGTRSRARSAAAAGTKRRASAMSAGDAGAVPQGGGSEGLASQRSMSEERDGGEPGMGRGKRQRVTKSALELLQPTREQIRMRPGPPPLPRSVTTQRAGYWQGGQGGGR